MVTPSSPDPSREAETEQANYEYPEPKEPDEHWLFLAQCEAEAERIDQENRGIPWAHGPEMTYEEMERRDAANAARKALITVEADAEAEAEPW
jgi:hypothetical protein